MRELKTITRKKAILKIVLSILVEILVIIMIKSQTGEEFAKLVCIMLFSSIVCLIYFISGIKTLLNDNKLLKEYMKNTNITIQQLENEIKSAKKIGSIYIGNQHIFSNDTLGVVVIPIDSIIKLEIVHLGANPVKLRNGYYYLYIYSTISDRTRKIYSVTNHSFKQVIEELKMLNENIECIKK